MTAEEILIELTEILEVPQDMLLERARELMETEWMYKSLG